jgi:formate hydrogenlyase subunit 4
LARSFLGKLFRAAADRRRGPPWVAEEQEGKDLAHRPKVYTKGSAVRIRAIAGLVIGTAWRLLVASPGPLFPRRVGAFTLRARDEAVGQDAAIERM